MNQRFCQLWVAFKPRFVAAKFQVRTFNTVKRYRHNVVAVAAAAAGIFMAMSVIGPAIGFVFGAATLEIFTDFYLFSKDE
jgi:hypothetical protein